VDKIKELRSVADMAFKSQNKCLKYQARILIWMRSLSGLTRSTAHLHPFQMWQICCDTYTMFKIERFNQGDRVRDFKSLQVIQMEVRAWHQYQTRCQCWTRGGETGKKRKKSHPKRKRPKNRRKSNCTSQHTKVKSEGLRRWLVVGDNYIGGGKRENCLYQFWKGVQINSRQTNVV